MPCSPAVIEVAYDRLVEYRDSGLLDALRAHQRGAGEQGAGLRHFAIFFDDGPCYDVVARDFTVRAGPVDERCKATRRRTHPCRYLARHLATLMY